MLFFFIFSASAVGDWKCRFGNQTISSTQFDDGQCDCCDGSDEFLICLNTCPISLSDAEIAVFRRFYMQGSDEKRRMSVIGQNFLRSVTETIDSYREQVEESAKLLESLKERVHEKKKALKQWVYETLGEREPGDRERLEYINKDKVGYSRRRSVEEEEEEEESMQELSEKALKERRKRRAAKWENLMESKFKDLLAKAIAKEQAGKYSGIAGRLKSLTTSGKPAVYNDYTKAIDDYEAANLEDSNLRNKLAENQAKILLDWTPDHSWLGKSPSTFTGRIKGTEHTLSFTLDGESKIITKEGVVINTGFWSSIENNTATYRVPGSPWITKVKFFCHHSPHLLDAVLFSDNRIRVEACSPDFCESSYSEEKFVENLRALQSYKHILLTNFDL